MLIERWISREVKESAPCRAIAQTARSRNASEEQCIESHAVRAIALQSSIKTGRFWKNLQKAWQYGLSAESVVKALTYTPAKFLGIENNYGNLKTGSIANFFIATDTLFGNDFVIEENFIAGEKYINRFKSLSTVLKIVFIECKSKSICY